MHLIINSQVRSAIFHIFYSILAIFSFLSLSSSAIAILSLVGTTVGGILIVSAQSYDNGMNEVELQQEAQMVVNQINDLIIDTTATESVSFADNTLVIPEGTKTHKVKYDAATKQLLYSCEGGALSGEELMANGITAFSADTASFKDSGNLYLDIGLERESAGGLKTFNATFQITARNGVVDTTPSASIDVIDDVVLEPNQSYTFNPDVVGISNKAVEWDIVGGNTDSTTHMLGNTIYIGSAEEGSIVHLLVKTATKDAEGNAMAMRAVRVRIRRVNTVTVKKLSVTGTEYKKDAEYLLHCYDKIRDYDAMTEKKKSLLWASPFLIAAVIVFLMHRRGIALLLLVVGMICLFQHRMIRKLAKEDVTNALYAAMPQWMIQMALLLQHNNVQVSIAKSMQSAPEILRPELQLLQERLSEHPESLAAYTDFWKDYDVPEAQSLMKMLHSIAEAGTGNANLQITNMLQRVQEMQQLSDQRQDESSRFKMQMVFLYPVFGATVKLLIDLTLGSVYMMSMLGNMGGV